MGTLYQHEIDAVNRIRSRNPHVAQRTLATRIHKRDFPTGTDDFIDACRAFGPWATIYSRIRTYDAKTRKQRQAAATN